MPEFVEFAGKSPYKCPKCKDPIRYAKFFGADKKILTTDGKEPNKIFGRGSNTGWPTDPETKQMHECKGDNSRNTSLDSSTDVGHNSQTQLTDMDKKVRDRMVDDAYQQAMFMIFKLQGVEKACKDFGIELGQVSGMIFKEVCAEDRSLKEHGE